MKRVLACAAAVAALSLPAFAQSTVVPKGTEFEAKLNQTLSTKKLHDGDTFTMTEHDGFFHKAPAALKGATIDGHVEDVNAAKLGHGASMHVILDDIVLSDGTKAALPAQVTSSKQFEAHHHYLRDAGLVVGGAVAGHVVSKRSGHKGGALAGAGAGFALASNLKSNIVVKKGTVVHIRLTQDLVPGSAS